MQGAGYEEQDARRLQERVSDVCRELAAVSDVLEGRPMSAQGLKGTAMMLEACSPRGMSAPRMRDRRRPRSAG